jgi:hypothetical protein
MNIEIPYNIINLNEENLWFACFVRFIFGLGKIFDDYDAEFMKSVLKMFSYEEMSAKGIFINDYKVLNCDDASMVTMEEKYGVDHGNYHIVMFVMIYNYGSYSMLDILKAKNFDISNLHLNNDILKDINYRPETFKGESKQRVILISKHLSLETIAETLANYMKRYGLLKKEIEPNTEYRKTKSGIPLYINSNIGKEQQFEITKFNENIMKRHKINRIRRSTEPSLHSRIRGRNDGLQTPNLKAIQLVLPIEPFKSLYFKQFELNES